MVPNSISADTLISATQPQHHVILTNPIRFPRTTKTRLIIRGCASHAAEQAQSSTLESHLSTLGISVQEVSSRRQEARPFKYLDQ